MKKRVILIYSLLLIGVFSSCNDETPAPSGIQFPDGAVFEQLSSYNLFEGPLADLSPSEGLVPYDLNTPLFTDYASKQRFVYVPDGSIIPYDTLGALKFPIGSILVKNFSYTLENGNKRIVETRLLLHQNNGWNAEVYYWNNEQTDASRLIVGKSEDINFKYNGKVLTTNYMVPNKNQCKNCHALGNTITPIGPKVGNLNKEYTYSENSTNQITKWIDVGILQNPTHSTIPKWPDFRNGNANLNMKARAYLEVNCGHCHNKQGAASNSGLYLDYYNTDEFSLGVNKAPVSAGVGSGGLSFDIVKGDAENSILYYRMNSVSVEVRMPELGRSLIDEEGVSLIKEWIDTL